MNKLTIQLKGLLQTRAHGGGALWVMRKINNRLPLLRRLQRRIDSLFDSYSNSVSLSFDTKYGTETFDRKNLMELDVAAQLDWDWLYGPINPDFFHEIFNRLGLPYHRYSFVDVGAGKGLCMMLASEYDFKRLIAVEFSEELVGTGKKNLDLFEKHENRDIEVEWVCKDFMKFQLPDEPLVLFFNNPFPEKIAIQALNHILSWVEDCDGEVILIYRKASDETRNFMNKNLQLLSWSPYWQAYTAQQAILKSDLSTNG